ncbi:hypothetical protein, partial [Prevotella sp.]
VQRCRGYQVLHVQAGNTLFLTYGVTNRKNPLTRDSYVAKYIRKIKFNLQLSNCEEDNIAGHIRRDFTKVRNLIAHDIEGDILLQKRL